MSSELSHEISNLTKKEWEPTVPGSTCARAGWDSEKFPEQLDLTLFSQKIFIRNFTMKYSIASKESWSKNGSGEERMGWGGVWNYSHHRRRITNLRWGKISDPLRISTWEGVTVEPSEKLMSGLESEAYSMSPSPVSELPEPLQFLQSLLSKSHLNIILVTSLWPSQLEWVFHHLKANDF